MSDYDLGEGTVPTAVYNDLAQFTYGAAYTESQTFPVSLKERVAAGNLDLYAMDTYKPTAQRHVHRRHARDLEHRSRESAAPVCAAGRIVSRSVACSASQPLDQAIQTGVRSSLSGHAAVGLAAARLARVSAARTASWSTPASASSTTSFPRRLPILPPTTRLTRPPLSAASAGRWAAWPLRPACRAARPTRPRTPDRQFQSAFSAGAAPCAGIRIQRAGLPLGGQPEHLSDRHAQDAVLLPVQPRHGAADGRARRGCASIMWARAACTSRTRWSSTATRRSAPAASRPIPIAAPARPALRQRERVSHRRQQQLLRPADRAYPSSSRGLTLRANYTLSHCLDEVSNGGLLSFSIAGHSVAAAGRAEPPIRRLRLRCAPQHLGLRHLPDSVLVFTSRCCARSSAAGPFSETAFFHSGLPFTVLSQPYTADGNGVFQASGPQFARRVPGVPLYRKAAYPGVTVAGTRQWLNPEAFVSVVDPTTGACTGGDSAANCQFGDAGRNTVRGPHFTDSDIYLTRKFPLTEKAVAALRHAVVQRLQPSQLRAAWQRGGRRARQSTFRQNSARSKAPSRRRPACSAWAWAETARRA